ncbi:MAG: OstA-like protein [Prevotella sp.]
MIFRRLHRLVGGHRIMLTMVLCLFALYVASSVDGKKGKAAPQTDERIYLDHSDELWYDMYGPVPDARIVKGNVHFIHKGAHLWCDSAYFYQESNSVEAFGHVRFKQGDTLSLTCDRADYDGQSQLMRSRFNVVLKHRKQILHTDSLDYDRLYSFAYFFEGGKLVDGNDQLVSDWGEYNTGTREAVFRFNVKLRSGKDVITTDTLYYDTRQSLAHVTGPSKVESDSSTIFTENAFFNTKTDQAELYGRSKVVNGMKTIVADSLYHDSGTGRNEGFGNVVYIDTENRNELNCGHLFYNDSTGYGYATHRALMKDFSQNDTLYMHADSIKIYTFNIDTDSAYRKVHAFRKVRAFRNDVQAVCDSLVFNSQDSCMTMYKDPIVWNANKQLLGETIKAYMNDSTVRLVNVIEHALSVEQVDNENHYNQISSKYMDAYFTDGVMRKAVSTGNVKCINYNIDKKDSTVSELIYLETDTMRMFLSERRQLERIWTSKARSTIYPVTQIPPEKYKLPTFAWFDGVRPKDKDDVFVWRGKGEGNELKSVERHEAPLQHLKPALQPREE